MASDPITLPRRPLRALLLLCHWLALLMAGHALSQVTGGAWLGGWVDRLFWVGVLGYALVCPIAVVFFLAREPGLSPGRRRGLAVGSAAVCGLAAALALAASLAPPVNPGQDGRHGGVRDRSTPTADPRLSENGPGTGPFRTRYESSAAS